MVQAGGTGNMDGWEGGSGDKWATVSHHPFLAYFYLSGSSFSLNLQASRPLSISADAS